MTTEPPVYQSDPAQEDDSGYEPGRLEHLVAGSRGRLLDARRTPVAITAVDAERASFEVEIDAFEDRGARWELAAWDVARFQFPHEAPRASAQESQALAEACRRFDRPLSIAANTAELSATLRAIEAESDRAQKLLAECGELNIEGRIEERRGATDLIDALERFLSERDLAELDREFARTFVSNPNSGELVKGHAIALAALGLHPFSGRPPRDPDLLRVPWSDSRRKEHLIARLGFMRALWARMKLEEVNLYRGAASETVIDAQPRGSLVSTTFSLAVAQAHFEGGPSTRAAVLLRFRVPSDRILMTFLETEAMNERFLEAEAVVIGDPGARMPPWSQTGAFS
jgi:hypothetical protein